jgi:DNA polymerase
MPAPLAGEAAPLLVKMLAGIGLRPEEVLQVHLQSADWAARLEEARPRVICALGRDCAGALWPGQDREEFSNLRGRVRTWGSSKGLATYEPAALIQDPDLKRPAWEDLKLVMNLLKEEK